MVCSWCLRCSTAGPEEVFERQTNSRRKKKTQGDITHLIVTLETVENVFDTGNGAATMIMAMESSSLS